MKEFTLEKSLFLVKSVGKASEQQVILDVMKEFILEKSHFLVTYVARALLKVAV